MDATQPIIVATDGSSLGNPGPGGWGWYVDEDTWAADAMADTTNNAMELSAIAAALDHFATDAHLLILSDSRYAINAVTSWVHGWKRRGWRTSKGRPVANRDLIAYIDAELARRGGRVEFRHVRGHRGHRLNEAADAAANGAATALSEGRPVNHGPSFAPLVLGTTQSPVAPPMEPPASVGRDDPQPEPRPIVHGSQPRLF